MNQKQLGILVALVVVLGGAGIVAFKNQKSDWSPDSSSSDDKVIADFPLNDVSEIAIRDKDGEVNLTKGEGGWTVKERGGYAANFDNIHELLRTVWEMEPVQTPKVGESHLGRLKLLDPAQSDDAEKAATRVEFRAGGASHTLRIGKEHMRKQQAQGPMGGGSFPDGRYVMVGDDLASISLVEATFSSVTSAAADWLNKDFIKVEKIKSITYTPAQATNAWSVTRDSDAGDYTLVDKKEGEELDSSKTSSLKYLMSSPSFVDVANDKKDEETGLDKPTKASIETFDGFSYDLSIGKQDDKEQFFLKFDVSAKIEKERKPAEGEKPEDKEKLDKEHAEKVEKAGEKLANEKKLAGTVFVVSKYTVDALMKSRGDLMKGPEKEGAAAAHGAGLPPGLNLPPGMNLPPGVNLPSVPSVPSVPPTPPVPPAPKAPAPKAEAPQATDSSAVKTPPLPSDLQKVAEEAVQKTLDEAKTEVEKAAEEAPKTDAAPKQ